MISPGSSILCVLLFSNEHEGESWQELAATALPKLQQGSYADYGKQKAAQFLANLGG